jgi:hypothetical protein
VETKRTGSPGPGVSPAVVGDHSSIQASSSIAGPQVEAVAPTGNQKERYAVAYFSDRRSTDGLLYDP